MLKKTSIAIVLLLIFYIANGQQYPYFIHYSFNKFIYNPATAGHNGYTNLSLIAHEQWLGLSGTPKTHIFTFDSRIYGDSYIFRNLPIRRKAKPKSKAGNTAWGAYIINDINGPISRTWVNGTYAYHIKLNEQQLSFGMSMLLFHNRLETDQLITYNRQVVDPAIGTGNKTYWIFDANFGAFLTSEKYYVGYSAIQLLNSNAIFGNNISKSYLLNRQHNIIAGYKYPVSDILELEPSVLLKIPETSQVQLDVSTKLTYNEKYWFGLNFKTGMALAVLAGLRWEQYSFGYAFENDFNSLAKQSLATHEIIVSAQFGDSARRYRWLNNY